MGIKGIVEDSFRGGDQWRRPQMRPLAGGKGGHGAVSMPFSCTIVSFCNMNEISDKRGVVVAGFSCL